MGRILVVEDEFLLAAHILDLLEQAGADVVGPVGELDEARILADDATLDGALLDVNILGGRVDDVADILRRRDVPFIFVTASDVEQLPPNCRDVVVVSKPFRDDDLMREVDRLNSEIARERFHFKKACCRVA